MSEGTCCDVSADRCPDDARCERLHSRKKSVYFARERGPSSPDDTHWMGYGGGTRCRIGFHGLSRRRGRHHHGGDRHGHEHRLDDELRRADDGADDHGRADHPAADDRPADDRRADDRRVPTTSGEPDRASAATASSTRRECDDGPHNGPGQACKADCTPTPAATATSGRARPATTASTTGRWAPAPASASRTSAATGWSGRARAATTATRSTTTSAATRASSISCGDGDVAATEECDDGNADNTDGCTNNCTLATCGDEFVQPSAGEDCDAGAANSDNGMCTATCKAAKCGDGFVWNTEGGAEVCDDGVRQRPRQRVQGRLHAQRLRRRQGRPGRGLRRRRPRPRRRLQPACKLEACGNEIKDPGEGCDDGKNGDQDDGCTDLCSMPKCGDGFEQKSIGEQCDLGGGNSNTGACTQACKDAVCGDGLILANVEQCDNGPNNGNNKACKANCTLNVCGDGFVGPGEGCDDGNRQQRRLHQRVQAGGLRRRHPRPGRGVRRRQPGPDRRVPQQLQDREVRRRPGPGASTSATTAT
jgi:cysteine-rich repeat protein